MSFQRYSATPFFGIPISPEADMGSLEYLRGLVEAYEVPAQSVPEERTEITPSYYKNPANRVFAALNPVSQLVTVEIVPQHTALDLPTTVRRVRGGGIQGLAITMGIEVINLPLDQSFVPLIGESPVMPEGVLALHELITYVPDD